MMNEEVETPSKVEENQLNSAEQPVILADVIKTSPGMSPAESLPIPTTSNTTASAFENEDNLANPLKRSWVKLRVSLANYSHFSFIFFHFSPKKIF